MRRLVATVLVQALVLTIAMSSSWHLHAYSDHDHPDHHHGPATHEHRVTADLPEHSADQDGIRVETVPGDDDPGRHALSFSTGATCGHRVEITVAIVPGPALMDPGAPTWSALAPTDVRAHGPPLTASTSPRAPPLLHLA